MDTAEPLIRGATAIIEAALPPESAESADSTATFGLAEPLASRPGVVAPTEPLMREHRLGPVGV